jgi:hypothetical protein
MTTRRYSRIALLAALAWVAGSAVLRAQTVEPPLALDRFSAEADSPCVALRGDGGVGCVWVSREAGRRRVVFREQLGGGWSEPVFFDGRGGDGPASPLLLYDRHSNPHLIWCDGPSEDGAVVVAYRHSGLWIRRGAISESSGCETASPGAAFDALGRLHVVWREGYGSLWRIIVATFETDGSARRQALTDAESTGLNLYPVVIGLQAPTVLWFAEDNPLFRLESRRYDAEAGRWAPGEPPPLDRLPTNRLPYLFGLESSLICAVWDDEVDGADRIFLGFSDELGQGEGLPVDDNPAGANGQPFAVLTDRGPVLCWRGETPGGPAVWVRRHDGGDWTRSAVLSLPEPPYASQPRVAADDEAVHVVWVSESADGGTGNLYYATIEW